MEKQSKPIRKRNHDLLYRIIYRLFYLPFRIDALVRFGVWGRAKTYREPILVLCNHTTDRDFLAVASYIRNHLYFVCSEHVVGMGLLGRAIRTLFDPITVFKGSMKTGGVMEILRRVKRGNSVLLFPEGRISHNGRSLPLGRSTAQLAKSVGCRVVTFRTVGGFFKQPRWQTYINKGKLFSAGIVNEYSPEELKAMDTDELLKRISEDLYVDAYAEQEKVKQPIRWERGIEQITRYYCVCPACHGADTLTVGTEENRNTVTCACGYSMTADAYGYLRGSDGVVRTPADWEELQNAVLTEKIRSGESLEDADVALNSVGHGFERTGLSRGTLTGTETGMKIGEYEFRYADIAQPEVLQGGSSLVFTAGGVHYELLREGACLAKYLTLWMNVNAAEPVSAT